MTLINLSKPTQLQVKHGIERILAVFFVATLGLWAKSNYSFNTSIIHAAVFAGITAVWQLVVSVTTESL